PSPPPPNCSPLSSQPSLHLPHPHSFPTRRSSDLSGLSHPAARLLHGARVRRQHGAAVRPVLEGLEPSHQPALARHPQDGAGGRRSEEHTSELQSRFDLVCRLLLEKKKNKNIVHEWIYNHKLNCGNMFSSDRVLLWILVFLQCDGAPSLVELSRSFCLRCVLLLCRL